MKKAIATFLVRLVAAVVIEGVIRKRGETVELNKAEAENLLYRGRAELVESDDDDEELNLSQMKKPQLVELAKEYGIENPDALTVDQLRDAIIKAAE